MQAQNNDQLRLLSALNQLFRLQAQDVARRTTLESAEAGKLPDVSGWVSVMAKVVEPLLLRQFQQGMLRTAARLGAKVNAGAVRDDGGVRSYAPGNAAVFGSAEKSLHLFRAGSRVVVKSPAAKQPALIELDLSSPRVLDAVNQASLMLCRETMETATIGMREAVRKLRALLSNGVPRGDAVAYLARQIRTVFADPMRAFRIATTEVSRAVHGGQLLAAEDAGCRYKVWIASSDACWKCLDLEGRRVKLREPFWVDPKGGHYAVVMCPPLHPHCQCSQEEEY